MIFSKTLAACLSAIALHYGELPSDRREDEVNHSLEGPRCIIETEWHPDKSILAVVRSEGHLVAVPLLHVDFPVLLANRS